MAGTNVTLKQLLDEHVKELAAAIPFGKEAYESFVKSFSAALAKPIHIPIPSLPRLAEEARKTAADALAPIEPAKALSEIAKAVSEAEKVFNGQNLAVLTGRVNVQLMVKVGDAAGAQANFDLAIGPSPQA
jgi:hypothetical protein